MNKKLHYNILVDLSKNLAEGLFPYIFANQEKSSPNDIIANNTLYKWSKQSTTKPNKGCRKTRKKLLYNMDSSPSEDLYFLNYQNNTAKNSSSKSNYQNYVRFKGEDINNQYIESTAVYSKVAPNVIGISRRRRFKRN